MKSVYVIQHTESEFLGRIEDHLEGRGIRFHYMRPFSTDGGLPVSVDHIDGLILLGGGPWGAAGGRDLPTLVEEVRLTWRCFERRLPVIGFGLGAQILAIAGGGRAEPSDLVLEVGEVRREREDALDGFLPERYPQVIYMRDRPVPPHDAVVLARDAAGRPAVFQIDANCLGFAGHPGIKAAMVEDLLMEFDDTPDDPLPALEAARAAQPALEDALVRIMTGMIRITGLMSEQPRDA